MKNLKNAFLFLLLFMVMGTLSISCGDDPAMTPDPTCFDNIQNGDETGVDCGGVCEACPTCTDGIENGDETGIDCGGSSCDACPTCFDGIENGDELGVDCGPSCFPCPFVEYMTCNINGVPFEALLVTGFDDLNTLEFQSDQSQERQLFFVLPTGTQNGTYALANNSGYSAEYRKLFEGEYTTETGTITIVDNNFGTADVTGTFEFTAVQYSFGAPIDTVIVTEGAFGVEYF